MKNGTFQWLRLLPATLGCLVAVSAATAQNDPLPQNAIAPGMPPPQMIGQPINRGMFQNYYPNTYAGATSAQMYVAPLPVPGNVGHTYYTYEALMPHEHLYAHKRVYYTPYGGAGAFYGGNPRNCFQSPHGGVNKTTVTWYSGGFHFGQAPLSIFPLQQLRLNSGRGLQGINGCSHCN